MTTNANEHFTAEGYRIHPDDLGVQGLPKERTYYACETHCCVRHFCKYGYQGCPVVTQQVTQAYACEQCTYDLEEAGRWSAQPYAEHGEVGYRVAFGLKREDESMEGMPTDAQVRAAVEQALAGLTVNGWTLTRIVGDDSED